jgi:hypothetical protein
MKAYLKHKHAKDGPKKWEEHWANIEELLSHAHGFQYTSPSQSQNVRCNSSIRTCHHSDLINKCQFIIGY